MNLDKPGKQKLLYKQKVEDEKTVKYLVNYTQIGYN